METITSYTPSITSSRKVQRAWAMYDWANSAYNLVITSTIFPAYYNAVTTIKEDGVVVDDTVNFLGYKVKNSALFDYSIAAAYLIIALISPILSSIADYRGNKKTFMQLFCFTGAISCCCLYFFKADTVELGVICAAIAALGYCGSLVFYNAYLPEIALPAERDRVSALGFSYGYIGSVLLQLICFLFVLQPQWFGITDDTFAPRLSFVLVGIWWAAFALIPFAKLPNSIALPQQAGRSVLTGGFKELNKVWQQLRHMPKLKTYLASFFFYSMGVQTVMLAATIFGSKELKLDTGQLIGAILVIQLVAILGAYIMAKLSERFGNLQVLFVVVLIWIGVCIAAYYTYTATEFYIVATVVGIIMGGIQSLSRSTYAKLMPPTHDTTSFFSFYDVTEKLAIVIGMFSFGYIDSIMNMRSAIIALITFFTLGALILYIAMRKK
ncbi:MFS transporter [Nemorincola caseinilytica]|uniref:MFS transporter n=1 Tax=Nemorincola caseinilytica TaxID=2054315 RepID=A0ABP8NHE5_9BACT